MISLTLSLIAVFIPLLFMTGLVGRMFREFALTLTIAVVASAIVSLTLTPMMCARLLRRVEESGSVATRNALTARFTDHRSTARSRLYHRSLVWVLRHQRATLLRHAGDACRRPFGSMSSCRRASCRCRTPA